MSKENSWLFAVSSGCGKMSWRADFQSALNCSPYSVPHPVCNPPGQERTESPPSKNLKVVSVESIQYSEEPNSFK